MACQRLTFLCCFNVSFGTSITYCCSACVLIVNFVELVLSNQKLKNALVKYPQTCFVDFFYTILMTLFDFKVSRSKLRSQWSKVSRFTTVTYNFAIFLWYIFFRHLCFFIWHLLFTIIYQLFLFSLAIAYYLWPLCWDAGKPCVAELKWFLLNIKIAFKVFKIFVLLTQFCF